MSAEPECWILGRVQAASVLDTTIANLGVFILVSITSDSFAGLRVLLLPNKKEAKCA